MRRIISIIIVALVTLLLLVAAWAFYDGTYQINYVRHDSPLREVVFKSEQSDNIKALILQVTPLGTSRPIVEKSILQHIRGHIRQKPDLPDQVTSGFAELPHFCVRLCETGQVLSGSGWTEAVFIFSPSNTLSDVIVADYGAWL